MGTCSKEKTQLNFLSNASAFIDISIKTIYILGGKK